jgi:tRNA threonylcarbamoyladenosine biosynthesis protein TsaB
LSEGLLLALDTSGPFGSVALGAGGRVVASVELEYRQEHASRLVPAIEEALARASVGRRDLSGILVGEGPGSFTGVRVAAATAKGLSRALGLPLWAVSSLTAAALAEDVGAIRYALFDARGDRVYGACYGVGSTLIEELVPPHGGTLRDALAGDVPAGAVFLGDAAERHRAAIDAAGFPVADPIETPLAIGLLRYMALRPETPPVEEPSSWEPAYVRASSAERLWSR